MHITLAFVAVVIYVLSKVEEAQRKRTRDEFARKISDRRNAEHKNSGKHKRRDGDNGNGDLA